MKLNITITNAFFWGLFTMILLSGGSVSLIWIHSENKNFQEELVNIEKRFFSHQNSILQSEVESIIHYLTFKEKEKVDAKRKKLTKQSESDFEVIKRIYENENGKKNHEEIKKEIVSYFLKAKQKDSTIFRLLQQIGGKCLVNEFAPYTNGRSIYKFTDANNVPIIQKMDKIAISQSRGFFQYTLGYKKRKELMAYVNYFKPLDMYMVTVSTINQSTASTQSEALRWIEQANFANDGYFFVIDSHRDIIMHPNSKELERHNADWKRKYPHVIDSLLIVSNKENGGFYRYKFPMVGAPKYEPKLSFAKPFQKWEWTIVGTVYINKYVDEREIQRNNYKQHRANRIRSIAGILLILFFVSVAIAFLLARMLKRNTLLLHQFFSQALQQEQAVDTKKMWFVEFKKLADSINLMLRNYTRSKKELQKSEARLTFAIENLPIPLLIMSTDGVPIYLNKAFVNCYGYQVGDFASSVDFFRKAFPDDNYRKSVEKNWQRALSSSKANTHTQEWYLRSKSDEEKDVFFNFVPMGSSQVLISAVDKSTEIAAENKLRDALVQLNAILENSPSIIATIQQDGAISYINRSFLHDEDNNKKTQHFFDLLPKNSQGQMRKAFDTVFDATKNQQIEYQDQKNNWWETLLIPLKNSADKTEEIIAISSDVTVRKWATKVLREREERFKELSDATFEGILILEGNLIIEANAIVSQIFGYNSSELVGSHINKLLELDSRTKTEIDQKKDTTDCTQTAGYKKNGERIYCEIRTKYSAYNGQRVNVTAIRDVTERIETQQALNHTEALLNTANQRSPIGILIVDTYTSKIHMANDASAEVLGLEKGTDIVGLDYSSSNLRWRFLHQDGKEMQLEEIPLYRSAKGEIIKNMKAIVRREDGTYRWTLINSAPIRSQQGFITAVVMTFPDITELKDTEQRLIEAKEKAEEADKLKSSFLANMSHEIRTPMNAIIGFADMLTDEITDPQEQREYINYIIENGNSLLNLIEDIMDISKIEAKQIQVQPSTNELLSFFKALDVLFKGELKRLNKSHIDLILEMEDSREVKLFHTDFQRLKQIFSNLLSNAIKFTDSGEVRFGYRALTDRLYFFVKDSGIGIPKENQDEIFNRFTKISTQKNKLYGGTGLGLAISKRLIELLSGKIGLNSQVGQGSLFYFSLPLQENEVEVPAPPIVVSSEAENSFILEGKRILIAEDEEANYKLIKAVFKRENVSLIRARNGYEVIHLLEQGTEVDIILMDIKMPVMDGYETIKVLKNKFVEIPVIAQTALAMSSDRSKILAAGFNDYIAKPLKKRDLLKKISLYI